jgi:ABC-type multidrug transport system fused ATPase/permease subunit
LDIGKKLFSFEINDSMDDQDFRRMGKAIQYRNMKKNTVVVMGAVFLTLILSLSISVFFLLLFIIIALEVVVFSEYSSRNIAAKIKGKLPIEYEFYEDALIEYMGGNSNTIMYSQFYGIREDQYQFTMVGKEREVVVVPKSLLDEKSKVLMSKLRRIIGG